MTAPGEVLPVAGVDDARRRPSSRDAVMIALGGICPGCGCARCSGYRTAGRLRRLGPSPIRRRRFAPARALLELPVVVAAENRDGQS